MFLSKDIKFFSMIALVLYYLHVKKFNNVEHFLIVNYTVFTLHLKFIIRNPLAIVSTHQHVMKVYFSFPIIMLCNFCFIGLINI